MLESNAGGGASRQRAPLTALGANDALRFAPKRDQRILEAAGA
ncbi:hypothetical protein [Rhodopseudomonas sp. P2A-2r]|nr:hypothetical protein [Rhodopseudomonas sp. P2A-2r]UZE47273.1 hypothetical protein ONR75_20160 [Rhodopseudomonas sp. P2A-2r]